MNIAFVKLEPQWLKFEKRKEGTFLLNSKKEEANGIRFLCPKCFQKNNGPIGAHQIICWSRSLGAPDEARPGPGRWTFEGDDFSDLTLNGDPKGKARSIQISGGCGWHGFITNGIAT